MSPSRLWKTPQRQGRLAVLHLLLYCISARARASQVLVPQKVNAVLGKNVTLECQVEVGTNLSLTQSSWERRLPTGAVTVAVYNPLFGISVPPEYAGRLTFRSPSSHDATILLSDVGFSDMGVYTCKVATFPLGNTQAATTVNVLVEPKVSLSAGPGPLVDGGNETVVATCMAERARPPAEVSWESALFGQSDVQLWDEPNGTTSTRVRYLWQPTRHTQSHGLTCVVRHPALPADHRIPYQLNVLYAPDISVVGYDGDWYVGRENVQLTCRANANPPAHHFRWIRLDSDVWPDGVERLNNTLLFLRPLQRNDSGVYRCEVANSIDLRSRDLRILIQVPPSLSSTAPSPARGSSSSSLDTRQRVLFTSPTLEALPAGRLGAAVGGAVGGALFLLLVLSVGGVCYLRRRHGNGPGGSAYGKPYPGGSAAASALHELRPATKSPRGGRDRDREEWGGEREQQSRRHRGDQNGDGRYAKGYTRAMRESAAQGPEGPRPPGGRQPSPRRPLRPLPPSPARQAAGQRLPLLDGGRLRRQRAGGRTDRGTDGQRVPERQQSSLAQTAWLRRCSCDGPDALRVPTENTHPRVRGDDAFIRLLQ
ncbi:nectin-3-like protein [Gadus chalcogrammus]|uniref:nectin-3-like protein n=1 Tax=Gadus chalcogrammus TaxID=1042646 RepID=UPI0024C2210C|nr:nectin-3-like protein [Gadus chalcogrammus]